MARPLRVEFSGAVYHITARGNEKRVIFKDARDYAAFERVLSELLKRFGVISHGYVFMGNHYHLLVETSHANLSQAIHYLNAVYTIYFNRRHNRVGHLFQGRYKALLVEKDTYLLALSRYIHLNPVRSGLVDDPLNYRWSSYPGFVNEGVRKEWVVYDWILSQFDRKTETAKKLYRRFISEGLKGEIKNPLSDVQKGFILGSDPFVATIGEQVKGTNHREIPDSRKFIEPVELEKICAFVSRYFKIPKRNLLKRNSKNNRARGIAIYLARHYSLETNAAIGKYFNIGYTGVSQAVSTLKRMLAKNRELQKIINGLGRTLK